MQDHLTNTHQQLKETKFAVGKHFPLEEDLSAKSARLAELNVLLDMDRPENGTVDTEPIIEDSKSAQIHNQER